MQTPYSNPKEATSLADLLSLNGRDALVIGGAGLLGGEISYALAELGARVIVASRDRQKCQSFVDQMTERFPGEHKALDVDITDRSSIVSLCGEVAEITGAGLDVLVNTGWSGRKNTFESISDDDWDLDIEVCLNGVFRTIKAATPLLSKSKGVIVNIASMYGHVAPDYRMYDSDRFANPPSYGAAKAGVIQLSKYLASFLAPQGIRVNCISPGPFPFESTQRENPDFIARLEGKNPMGRIGNPIDIKGAAALLCSDAGAYITGQNICVDGGWTIW
ncbi:SDR family NAD(P)-dependent oxidoreductase [Thalassospira australica]|uniref:SDR family NAD(P)-dependent oxidoreductase n=1 Tax=Thalassospira australica TaxID=1528106 RepID=UPI00068A0DA5|nr:SDR family oxidoreductase [Thalassospira australica]